MRFIIHKNHHRAKPLYWLRWFPLLISPTIISRRVFFDFNAKYELPGGDQDDHNKLFGVAFGGVHKYSARFGWRWSYDKNKFILSAYVYDKGVRQMFDLAECSPGIPYDCSLEITGTSYIFTVKRITGNGTNQYWFSYSHNRKMCLLLGLFFGGNQPAPHTMQVEIKKIK